MAVTGFRPATITTSANATLGWATPTTQPATLLYRPNLTRLGLYQKKLWIGFALNQCPNRRLNWARKASSIMRGMSLLGNGRKCRSDPKDIGGLRKIGRGIRQCRMTVSIMFGTTKPKNGTWIIPRRVEENKNAE